MRPNAFIVHGHNVPARNALANFLQSIGVGIKSFNKAASNDMTGTNIASVLAGIRKADVVLVLFTPDEQVALFDSSTGEYVQHDEQNELMAGWQPRPNVILEAGVAAAVARKKTALIKLGSTRRISDLDGVRHIELHKPQAHEEIWDFISSRVRNGHLKEMTRSTIDALHEAVGRIPLKRWHFHDELGRIERDLRIRVDRSRKTFVDVLAEYAHARDAAEWSSRDLADYFLQRYDYSEGQTATDGFFWNLVIHGVIVLNDIESWTEPRKQLWWHELEADVDLAPRGRALLQKLRAMNKRRVGKRTNPLPRAMRA